MNNADEIRKQIQVVKDEIVNIVRCAKDYQYLVSTGALERLGDDLINLEHRLIEVERVILKPVPDFDSLQPGQVYFVSCNKGAETTASYPLTMHRKAVVITDCTQIFIPVE